MPSTPTLQPSTPLPVTTMTTPPSPILEPTSVPEPTGRICQLIAFLFIYNSLVEPTKKTGKSFFIKMRLIGRIVVDYFIDLFNRSSRDYRDVSRKLSDMKSQDKINQQEERIRAQTIVATVKYFIHYY